MLQGMVKPDLMNPENPFPDLGAAQYAVSPQNFMSHIITVNMSVFVRIF